MNYKYIFSRRCPHGVVVNMMDCNIILSEFELQSQDYVHFQTNSFGKGMNLVIPTSMV